MRLLFSHSQLNFVISFSPCVLQSCSHWLLAALCGPLFGLLQPNVDNDNEKKLTMCLLALCCVTDVPGPRTTVKGRTAVKGPGAKQLGNTSVKAVKKTAAQSGRRLFFPPTLLAVAVLDFRWILPCKLCHECIQHRFWLLLQIFYHQNDTEKLQLALVAFLHES